MGTRSHPHRGQGDDGSPCVLHRRAQVLLQSLQEGWQIPSGSGLRSVPHRRNPISQSPNASDTSWRSEIKHFNPAVHWSVCGCTKTKQNTKQMKKPPSSGAFPSRTNRGASGLSQIRIRLLPLTIRLHHILLFATVWAHTERKQWKGTWLCHTWQMSAGAETSADVTHTYKCLRMHHHPACLRVWKVTWLLPVHTALCV